MFTTPSASKDCAHALFPPPPIRILRVFKHQNVHSLFFTFFFPSSFAALTHHHSVTSSSCFWRAPPPPVSTSPSGLSTLSPISAQNLPPNSARKRYTGPRCSTTSTAWRICPWCTRTPTSSIITFRMPAPLTLTYTEAGLRRNIFSF
jgi:hypothetical protein